MALEAAVRRVGECKTDFRNSDEELFKVIRLSLGHLRNKILEDSEENLQKSEWKIGLP